MGETVPPPPHGIKFVCCYVCGLSSLAKNVVLREWVPNPGKGWLCAWCAGERRSVNAETVDATPEASIRGIALDGLTREREVEAPAETGPVAQLLLGEDIAAMDTNQIDEAITVRERILKAVGVSISLPYAATLIAEIASLRDALHDRVVGSGQSPPEAPW